MTQIVINVQDEQKAKRLFALLNDLDYVEARVETSEKLWEGNLPVFNDPVFIPGFKMFTREELYDR
jgi:hypothetical protein